MSEVSATSTPTSIFRKTAFYHANISNPISSSKCWNYSFFSLSLPCWASAPQRKYRSQKVIYRPQKMICRLIQLRVIAIVLILQGNLVHATVPGENEHRGSVINRSSGIATFPVAFTIASTSHSMEPSAVTTAAIKSEVMVEDILSCLCWTCLQTLPYLYHSYRFEKVLCRSCDLRRTICISSNVC